MVGRLGRHPGGQDGFALLGAILIAAIVVALALAIGQRSSFAIAATARVLEADAAAQIFSAIELEAQQLLRADAALGQSDGTEESWADRTLSAAQPGAAGEGELRDLQGRFNLNNLVADPAWGQAAGGAPAPPAADDSASLPQASTGPGRAAPANNTRTAPGAALPPRGASPGGARPGAAPNPATAQTTPGPTAAPARSGGDPDVLVPRDNVTLPVGIYTDNRPRGGERGPGGRAPDLPATGPGSAGATAAPSGTAATAAGSAERGAGRRPSSTAARQALAAMPAVAAARGPAAAMPAGAPGASGAPPAERQLAPHEIALARFSLLLAALEIEAEILPAILDWLDADTDARYPGGAEDDYYMNLDAPYRAANRPFADVTELRLVRGVSAEIYERLAPFVVALPVATAVNVNTAPLEVLMSLGPGIDRGTAEILVSAREVQPFQTVDAFTGFPMLVGRPLLGDGLSTQSEWFALPMQAEAGASILSARALLARSGPEQVEVVARTQGFFDAD